MMADSLPVRIRQCNGHPKYWQKQINHLADEAADEVERLQQALAAAEAQCSDERQFGSHVREILKGCDTCLPAGETWSATDSGVLTYLRDIVARCREQEIEIKTLRRIPLGEIWYWQGDEWDLPESLSCPVIMEPEKLRVIVAKLREQAEQLAELREELADAYKSRAADVDELLRQEIAAKDAEIGQLRGIIQRNCSSVHCAIGDSRPIEDIVMADAFDAFEAAEAAKAEEEKNHVD